MPTYQEKKETLNRIIKECKHPAVAYSGGVDSALLAKLAIMFHPLSAKNYSAVLPYLDEADLYFSLAAATTEGMEVKQLELNPDLIPEIYTNTKKRCYLCKKLMLSAIREKAEKDHCRCFLEGSNADDLKSFRPGRKAAEELNYRFPLAEAGFTKEDVRRYAKELDLAARNRPSKPCLLTRFPYNLPGGITHCRLSAIKYGEHLLKAYLTDNFRLRWLDDNTAEIEASKFDQQILKAGKNTIFKALPFQHISVAAEPFQSGRFDRIKEEKE